MDGCAAEHHAHKVGLGETGDTVLTGWGRTQVARKFLQGGSTGDSIVWIRDVGLFVVNGEEGRGDTHGVPATDHWKVVKVIRRWGMGDTRGGRRTRGSRNQVGEDLHRYTAGNRGAVGGSKSLILGVCKGDRVRRRG